MPKHNKPGLAIQAIRTNPNMPAPLIAQKAGLPYFSIVTAARRHGIILPKTPREYYAKVRQRRQRQMFDLNGIRVSRIRYERIITFKAMLPQLDYKERLNAEDMASRMGVTATTIRYWLQILNHRPQNHNGRTVYCHDKSGWPAIVDPLLKAGKSIGEICKAMPGVAPSSIYRWMANTQRIEVNERDRSTYKSASPV
jgi:DNA-binding transcriptional MerR regulator